MSSPSPPTYRLALGFILICLIWGSTWLAMKEGLQTVPPFSSAAVRFLLAILVLSGILYHRNEKLPRDISYWRLAAEVGLLIYGLPFALIYWGQARIPSGLSSVMFATFPFFVAIFDRIRIPGERLDPMKLLGVLVGFFGIYVVFAGELSFDGSLSPYGMGAVVISAAMQAYGLITIKKKGREVHPIALTLGGIMFGAIFLLVASFGFEDFSLTDFNATAIASIFYLAIFGTTVTFITYFWLVKHMDPVILSLTAFITPIVALTLGSVVRNEHVGVELIIGAGLVLTGILAANGRGLVRLVLRNKAPRTDDQSS